jgi:hypothetical protein
MPGGVRLQRGIRIHGTVLRGNRMPSQICLRRMDALAFTTLVFVSTYIRRSNLWNGTGSDAYTTTTVLRFNEPRRWARVKCNGVPHTACRDIW